MGAYIYAYLFTHNNIAIILAEEEARKLRALYAYHHWFKNRISGYIVFSVIIACINKLSKAMMNVKSFLVLLDTHFVDQVSLLWLVFISSL